MHHLGHGAVGIPRLQLHASHRIGQKRHVEPLFERLKRGLPDAVVRCEPPHVKMVQSHVLQQHDERRVMLRYPLHGGVPVVPLGDPLGDDDGLLREHEPRVELGSLRLLNAMGGPDAAVFDEMPALLRVPVPGGEDGGAPPFEQFEIPVQNRYHQVSLGDRKRPAGAEIDLHIDNE